MTKKPQLSAFVKELRRSYQNSRAGTIRAERRNINQSPSLKLFTMAERTGQPIKAQEWRT